MLNNKKPSFMEADYTLEVGENKSDVPNILSGATVYVKIKDTAKAGTFAILPDGRITQLKEDSKVLGEIVCVCHNMDKCKFPIIHSGNNWFGCTEEDMKEINETYPFRCQADVDEHERRIEEKFQAFLRKKEKLQEMPVS